METITKEFELPSRGIFGGPEKVTVRPMTTKEEKIVFTARDGSFLEKLVKACIVEPANCDLDLMHSADITYLLFMIREMTFGPTYKQKMQCPYCNQKQDIEIDITEMTTYMLDENELKENSTIKLPVSGDTLEIKLLTNKDINDINKKIKSLTRQNKLKDPDGYEYTYRFAMIINTINGETREVEDVINYLDNLNLRDFDEIKKSLSNK